MKNKMLLLLSTILIFSCNSNIKEHKNEKIENVVVKVKEEIKEEKKDEIQEKVEEETNILENFEVKEVNGKEKYFSKILNKELKIEDIFRYKYKRILEEIDSSINLEKINVNSFKITNEGIYLGDNFELFLDYQKYIRLFKANIGFKSIYNGEKIEVKKRKIIPGKKYVAFTYDDGPGNQYHDLIREIFNEIDMSATFYVVGQKVKAHPDKLLKTYKDGHEIANHTWSHPDLRKLTPIQIWKEFGSTNEQIFKVIGVEPEYIRPPYGAVNQKVRDELNNKIALWSVDSEDWRSRNTQKIVNMVLKDVKDGSVVLFHDLYKESYEATKILVPMLLKEGYQFVTFSELLEIKEKKSN